MSVCEELSYVFTHGSQIHHLGTIIMSLKRNLRTALAAGGLACAAATPASAAMIITGAQVGADYVFS